jgi:hypothetical protein
VIALVVIVFDGLPELVRGRGLALERYLKESVANSTTKVRAVVSTLPAIANARGVALEGANVRFWLRLRPPEPAFSTTEMRLRPDARRVSTALGRRAKLPWAALDRLFVTRSRLARFHRPAPLPDSTSRQRAKHCAPQNTGGRVGGSTPDMHIVFGLLSLDA